LLEILIILVVLLIDQVSKHMTEANLALGESIPIWEGVFEFSNVHNTGAAWGMFAGGRWVFIPVTIAVCVLMLCFLFKQKARLGIIARICLALLFAGAVGNLIDRVFLGYVRDMLYFSLINFPVFNVADSAVCIGAGLMVIDTLFVKNGKSLFDVMESLFEKKSDCKSDCEFAEDLENKCVCDAEANEMNTEEEAE